MQRLASRPIASTATASIDQRLARHQEAVLRAIAALERSAISAATLVATPTGNLERRVGAFVLEVQRAPASRCRRAAMPCALDLVAALRVASSPSNALDCAERVAADSTRLDRLLAQRAHVGEPHAVRRQHARERMDEHARHAQRVGDEARVLAAGAAEAAQRVLGDVVAALHRDVLDRVGHVLDRDLAGSRRRLPRACARTPVAASTSSASAANFAAHHVGVERLVAVRSEHVREKTGSMLADHHVAVGDRERTAAPVRRRARDWRPPTPAPRESARRRTCRSIRRPPRRCGSASSARAGARPRPRSRTRARTRPPSA